MIKKCLLLTTALSFLFTAQSSSLAIEQHKVDELLSLIRGKTVGVHANAQIDPFITNGIRSSASKKSLFPMAKGEVFLRGEDDIIGWDVYLSQNDALAGIELEFGFENSATVLPEQSVLSLHVNGRNVASSAIQAAQGRGTLAAKLDASILVPGVNKINIRAQQHHRVDCSLEATYELWTRLLPSRSFIHYMNTNSSPARLEDIRGLVRNDGQTENLYIINSGNLGAAISDQMLERYAKLLQEVSRIGKFDNPKVEFIGNGNHGGPGLDVFVGTQAELKHNAYIKKAYGNLSSSELVRNVGEDITYTPSSNGERILIARFDQITPSQEMEDRHNTAGLEPTQLDTMDVSFEKLGFQSIEYTGKRLSRKLRLELPADFYPSDYDTVKLHLFGSYAAGLKKGQRLLVHVNEESITSIPFSKKSGDVIYDRVLEIPLSAFKPGSNEIDIVAMLELEDERACDLLGPRKRESALFLSDKSYFEVPTIARAGRFPDVRNTLATGFPYRAQDDRGPLSVELGGNRQKSFEVAASLLAQISAASGTVIPVKMDAQGHSGSKSTQRNILTVSPFTHAPQRFVNLRPEVQWTNVEQNWQTDALVAREIDYITTASVPSDAAELYSGSKDFARDRMTSQIISEPLFHQEQENSARLQARFKEHAEREMTNSISFSLTGQLSSILKPFGKRYASIVDPALDIRSIPADSRLVVSQAVDGNSLVTYVGYPEHRPNLPLNLQSRITTEHTKALFHTIGLTDEGSGFEGIEAYQTDLLLSNNWSLSNIRLVAAGWFSNKPLVFAGLVLSVLLIWSYCTTLVLNRTKRSVREGYETDA